MKVTINRNSWHYRWYEFIADKFTESSFSEPQSVCTYFWGFVFMNLYAAFISAGLTLMVGFCVYMITAPAWYFFFPNVDDAESIRNFGIGIDSVILLAIATVLLSRKGSGFIGVIKAYIWGVKNKVCPIIEYKEE